MTAGIALSDLSFTYDVQTLAMSFFPGEEIKVFAPDKKEACDRYYEISPRQDLPRHEAKNDLKRRLYHLLSEDTGKTLPWGTLTGIRPTKIPFENMRKGTSFDDAARLMRESYYTSEEKAALACRVAERELGLFSGLDINEKSYSLYINIPFCPTICAYCTFSSTPVGSRRKDVAPYLSALTEEMRYVRRVMDEEGFAESPTTVYIGGGTPTTLEPSELEELMGAAGDIFRVKEGTEYTVEAGRPDSITRDKLDTLIRMGCNRISVNPQSMNEETLRRIGRFHSAEETKEAFIAAREAGFANINTDIILGLPGEDEAAVARTLEAVAEMKPDALTVHTLAVKRASRLKEKGGTGVIRAKDGLLDRMMDMASRKASDLGMRPYYLYRQKQMAGNLENVGYALPGKECLYNSLIMEDAENIAAFGCGSSSKRVFSEKDIRRQFDPKDLTCYLERAGEIAEKKRLFWQQG